MSKPKYTRESGFTMVEMLITLIIMVVVLAIAVPSFVVWLPNYRLSSAARDLFSSMQQAKMAAIQNNGTYTIVFNAGTKSYEVQDKSGNPVKKVDLADYDSNITYGNGNAANQITGAGFGGDFITYVADASSSNDEATFTSRGLGKTGYVYLANQKGTAYVVGSQQSGIVIMRKWMNGSWQ